MRSNPQCTQLRTDLLFRIDSKHDFPSSKGMIRPSGLQQMRSLAGVDDNNALTVFDRPCIRWQPLGPVSVRKNGQLSRNPVMPVSFDLCAFYFDEAGLDRVYLHGWNLRS